LTALVESGVIHFVRLQIAAIFLCCTCAAKPPAAANKAVSATGATASPAASTGCGAPQLTEGRANPPVDKRAKPKKGEYHDEPSFHTCVVRATDHEKEGIDGFSRSDYSRRQAFNADSSFFFTNTREGGWFYYDAKTLEKIGPLQGLQGDAEPQWHPSDPNTLYYGYRNGGMEIMSLNVRSMNSRSVADFSGKVPWKDAARCWTRSEGSPSRDGRYWALQCETEKFDIRGYAVWDLVNKRVVGTKPSSVRPDHVSMTPSGRWVVTSGDEHGTSAWSLDWKTQKKLHKLSEHSDIGIGANGHDYYVSVDYQSNEGYIFMVDIDTGERTNLIRTYNNGSAAAFHFSAKNYDKPGWVLVSSYNDTGPNQWFMSKVFIMELKENPRIYQLAAHHSNVKDAYMAEPHATVNRDFTRVLFNSNWGVAGSDNIDAYLIKVPSFP
jgi:hypothetical protein